MSVKNVINELIQNTKKKCHIFVLYFPGPITVMYNI